MRLQRHRQRHQARLQKRWDNQKDRARIAREEHLLRMQQMEEAHQAKMQRMEQEHQANMKTRAEQIKARLHEIEKLKILQLEQILETNDSILRLEDKAQNSVP